MKNEIRFKQIACTFTGEGRNLYGLTQDGRVYWYDDGIWLPLSMIKKSDKEEET